MAAALELIAENGVDALTLSQVARRAGVSRATAYREFGDKDGLLAAVAQHEIARMAAATFDGLVLDADPVDSVAAVVVNALNFLRSHAAFAYVRDRIVETVAATVAPIIDASDTSRLAMPAPQVAELIVRTVLSHSVIQASTLSDRDVADAVARAIIAPPQA